MEQQAFFGLRIQILDDNPFYTTLFKQEIERFIRTEYTAHQAHFLISSFTNSQDFFDQLPAYHSISFVDYHLGTPENGIDVLEKIKMRTPFAQVYIVTDENNSYILRTCLESGANGIIFKNNELIELSTLVIHRTINNPSFPFRLNNHKSRT